jgi:hypothetical protein
MSIYDLKVGDKLEVLINGNGIKKDCYGDILKITNITQDSNNTLWILHENNSFSGGGFRIKDEDNNYSAYTLGVEIRLFGKTKKENYKYLIKLFKQLNIK